MIATRNIGATDTEVTELSFGGAPLGAVGDRITDDEAAAIMHRAREGGMRYFDTAPLYGHGLSEKRVGRVLRELPRDDFVLSTKVGRLLVPADEGERYAGMRDAEPVAIRYDYSFDAVRRSLEASLARLGLDRVDILLCHDIDIWTHGDAQPGIFEAAKNGALPALGKLRQTVGKLDLPNRLVYGVRVGERIERYCDVGQDLHDIGEGSAQQFVPARAPLRPGERDTESRRQALDVLAEVDGAHLESLVGVVHGPTRRDRCDFGIGGLRPGVETAAWVDVEDDTAEVEQQGCRTRSNGGSLGLV